MRVLVSFQALALLCASQVNAFVFLTPTSLHAGQRPALAFHKVALHSTPEPVVDSDPVDASDESITEAMERLAMPDADNEESEEAAGAGLQMLDAAGDDDAAHPDASEPEAPAEGIAESEFSESPGDEFLQSAVSEESDDMSAVEESAEANPAEDSYDASDYAGESAHQDFEGSWMDDGDYEGSAEMDEDPSNDIQAANNRLVDSWNPRETPRRERMQEKGPRSVVHIGNIHFGKDNHLCRCKGGSPIKGYCTNLSLAC